MRRDVLDATKLRILKLQAPLAKERRFFLAGGTALALRFGHRTSRDLDWFSNEFFDQTDLTHDISGLSERPSNLQASGAQTVRAYYGALETSFIKFGQAGNLTVEELDVDGVKVPIASIELIAVMKAGAIINRGTKRDFVDAYAICTHPGWSISKFIDLATQKLPIQAAELARALTYFADAERDPLPERCKFTWPVVKEFLTAGVAAWQTQNRR
jgi:hypothetical protein